MSQRSNSTSDTSALPWPAGGLEDVGACPVCGEMARTILHRDLADDVFRCAPGKWSLWRCSGCESAYLDPRPTPATIHIAYQSYYTHSAGEGRKVFETLGLLRRLRRRLSNGYANWRYDAKREPTSILGVPLAYCFPPLKNVVDRAFRHLPRKASSCLALLDVGCGNGKFLEIAVECGWKAVGVDPDPKAVAKAQELGFEVYEGGVEVFQGKQALFDFISLSHVIEHVHSPMDTLKNCFELLKPGGVLWIETPNIKSLGHMLFSRWWRGIEAPRHLCIFNPASLAHALRSCGYERISRCPQSGARHFCFSASHDLKYKRNNPKVWLYTKALALLCDSVGLLMPHSREFVAVITNKPALRGKTEMQTV